MSVPHRFFWRIRAFSPSLFGDGLAVFLRFAPLLALSVRTAGIHRTVDTPFLSIAVAQLRQRPICSAISPASKGDFGTKRPISSSFQRKQHGERPLPPVLRLPFPHPCAGNRPLPSEKRRSPRIGSPSAATGRGANRPSRRTVPPSPLLANALSLCPAAPPRLRSLSPIVFPQLSCPNFFSPACCSVRLWWFPPLYAPPNLNPSAHRACSSPIATPGSPFRAPWCATADTSGALTRPVCSSSTKMPSTATVSP